MSQTNWKPGDIGICINAGRLPHQSNSLNLPPLRLKAEYLIQNTLTCGCGAAVLDVGIGLPKDSQGVLCGCGGRTSPAKGIHWVAAERFVKKQTRSEIESQIEEAIADENYELAQELTLKLE
jgi:hypothetical protein